MRFYAVYDTNVLISSLLTGKRDSATALVVDAIAKGDITPLYSQEILDEYDDVLHRDKFSFSKGRIQKLLKMIREFGVKVDPGSTGEALIDMDDLVFYEVVMEKREDGAYLITGNIRHFPPRNYIVTPAEMMEIVSGESQETFRRRKP